jgi:YggT family protein
VNDTVASLFTYFLWALIIALLLRSVLSWFPMDRNNPFVRLVDTVTDPLVEPVRRVMPRTGMIDFSAFVVMIVLYIMLNVVEQVRSR